MIHIEFSSKKAFFTKCGKFIREVELAGNSIMSPAKVKYKIKQDGYKEICPNCIEIFFSKNKGPSVLTLILNKR